MHNPKSFATRIRRRSEKHRQLSVFYTWKCIYVKDMLVTSVCVLQTRYACRKHPQKSARPKPVKFAFVQNLSSHPWTDCGQTRVAFLGSAKAVTRLGRTKRGDGSVRDNRKGRGSGPEPPRCHVFPFVQNLSMSRCERPAVGCEQNASESPRCTSRDLA